MTTDITLEWLISKGFLPQSNGDVYEKWLAEDTSLLVYPEDNRACIIEHGRLFPVGAVTRTLVTEIITA